MHFAWSKTELLCSCGFVNPVGGESAVTGLNISTICATHVPQIDIKLCMCTRVSTRSTAELYDNLIDNV